MWAYLMLRALLGSAVLGSAVLGSAIAAHRINIQPGVSQEIGNGDRPNFI
jgi:hypothetical protein